MKRSRSPDKAGQAANGVTSRKRQITIAEDDDPYGLNVGAPGFLSKPGGNKGGYVPGYLRVPGSAMAAAPSTNDSKPDLKMIAKPISHPYTATFPPVTVLPRPAVPALVQPAVAAVATPSQPEAQVPQPSVSAPLTAALNSTAQPANVRASAKPSRPLLPPPEWSSEPSQPSFMSSYIPLDIQGYNADRRRLQSKDLPEQHRLPDDLPDVQNSSAKSASGPLSAEMPVLPAFHDEILKFVELAAPNQTEQLTKVTSCAVRPIYLVVVRSQHAHMGYSSKLQLLSACTADSVCCMHASCACTPKLAAWKCYTMSLYTWCWVKV